MEAGHAIDVSWMTHGGPKDRPNSKDAHTRRSSVSTNNRDYPTRQLSSESYTSNGNMPSTNGQKTPSPSRPGFIRGSSTDNRTPPSAPLQRRSSWFSNISSRFSSSSSPVQSSHQAEAAPPRSQNVPVPKVTPAKNAVLQHAAKVGVDGPYTPAPPRNAGLLGVFRRLSSSSSSGPTPGAKGNHGLVDRVVLNVDHNRERCNIKELNQAKLRRVSFCVDVEIAPMPKYSSDQSAAKKIDKAQARKASDREEAAMLRNTDAAKEVNKLELTPEATRESAPTVQEEVILSPTTPAANSHATIDKAKKKKKKKKKTEAERRARKEKKRQLAEANGTIPMEIHRSSTDSSSCSPTTNGFSRTQAHPTTNPVRIYRRCCQLRESSILKRITEQLGKASNSGEPGLVEKLDLTGYYLGFSDLVILGDYFALVPIREVILEGCGMTDEGLRVVLAGLLAAKKPEMKRGRVSTTNGLAPQGGVVERLVIKNNKIGQEGWRHIALFICMCRSIKGIDLSDIRFPRPTQTQDANPQDSARKHVQDYAGLFSRALGDRLAGSELELLNLGGTELEPEQLGVIIDGIIKCGITRLGLANNKIDIHGLEHVARYLREARCQGLDLGGNDLREHLDIIGDALSEEHPLWALGLSNCNLYPPSLCKLFPKLVKTSARFIDLSGNRDLFHWEPSAVSVLRRYLPKMAGLKRVELADVAMTSEQAIQIAEILPEVPHLAHINLLENPRLGSLADAKTEESREEACALYASLLAATRVSNTIVSVDIDVPRDSASEVVKALAKQVVAYCLRNMERTQMLDLGASAPPADGTTRPETPSQSGSEANVPDVLLQLAGNGIEDDSKIEEPDAAMGEDYVIGGSGLVKALAVCLDNRGGESRRQSGEFMREVETGSVTVPSKLPAGKAKDMSKNLLQDARKMRVRLQPALAKAKGTRDDGHNYQRLLFLDRTLDGMIKRFEDEFPETKEQTTEGPNVECKSMVLEPPSLNVESSEVPSVPDDSGILSEDDETNIKPRSQSNSILSHSSKALAEEEGRTLRTVHKIRRGLIKDEHYEVLGLLEALKDDQNHVRLLNEMLEDLNDEDLNKKAEEIGVVDTFKTEKHRVFKLLREENADHWDTFVESQEKAMKNAEIEAAAATKVGHTPVEENTVAED